MATENANKQEDRRWTDGQTDRQTEYFMCVFFVCFKNLYKINELNKVFDYLVHFKYEKTENTLPSTQKITPLKGCFSAHDKRMEWANNNFQT